MAGRGDLNGDGSLDLHVTEWHGNRRAEHARLFLGDGASFRDETDAWGASMVDIGRAGVWSFTSNLLDVDADGRIDLFVAADFGSSRVFWNDGDRLGDGTADAGVGTDENGMGSALGDIDRGPLQGVQVAVERLRQIAHLRPLLGLVEKLE